MRCCFRKIFILLLRKKELSLAELAMKKAELLKEGELILLK